MAVFAPIRKSFEQVLAAREYALKDKYAPMRGYAVFLDMAKQAGFAPGTVIDVGVAQGTPWLHDAFPDAHLVLIEPQSQFKPVIDAILQKRRGEWHQVALGAQEATAHLNIMTAEPGSSSLHSMSKEHIDAYDARGIDHDMHSEEVRVMRLDSIDSSAWPKPWLLKIDVEGHELGVLAGAAGALGDVAMIIAELSINNAYAGPSFATSLLTFENAGFPLYEIIEMQARGRFGRVTMVDGVFLPAGHSVLEPELAHITEQKDMAL
jgi:FkbM family methyltransferase